MANSNPYLGAVNVNGGTLAVTKSTSLGLTNLALTVNGILDMRDQSISVDAFNGSGTVTTTVTNYNTTITTNINGGVTNIVTNTFVAPVTLSVGTSSNSNSVFAGSIQDGVGTLSLNKLGSATLALTGTNTFSGLLTISKGAVLITNPASLSTNATLSGGGSASTAGT